MERKATPFAVVTPASLLWRISPQVIGAYKFNWPKRRRRQAR